MIVLGLTGSVGMGKSTTASMFAELGVPVYDADAEVHKLYAKDGAAIAPLVEAFGDVLADNGGIDRANLRAIVISEPNKIQELESIVHPLTATAQINFKEKHKDANLVVLDIPLLFEVGGDARCDYVAVVTAPLSVQRERVLTREGMTEEVFQSILAKQMPDAEKRARADFVISTAFGLDFTQRHVRMITELLEQIDA